MRPPFPPQFENFVISLNGMDLHARYPEDLSRILKELQRDETKKMLVKGGELIVLLLKKLNFLWGIEIVKFSS